MSDLRIALDKIVKIELGEAYTQGSTQRMPLKHIDTSLEDINTAKQWIRQAIQSSAILDINSNVPQDKFLQKKLSATFVDLEKVENDLKQIATFIQTSFK